MRRQLALALPIALVVLAAPSALAIGSGGWNHVGVGATSSTSSLDAVVNVLNTENPGVLYAGGGFTTAGGHTANRVARWNGSSWSALPGITNGGVFALAYKAGRVFAGGTFQNAGGNPNADFLAVWNGSTWAPACTSTVPGPAITANVNALQIIGNTLYVGGAFADGAGIPEADRLLACDLTTGAPSATVNADGDINGGIYALTADSNGTLYAGGQFINLDGIAEADHVASYDGSWHAMGTGTDDYVRSLTAVGTDVYIGTDARDVAGIANADHVVRWDGSAWSAVGSNSAGTNGWFPTSAFIYGLTHYGSTVIAVGSFQNANGIATADQVAYFDGTTWRPIGSNGAGNGPLGSTANAAAVTGGQVYVGGNFTSAGGDTHASYLASYALRLPDASIGATTTGTFVGNNVYSSSGVGELRHVVVKRGKRSISYVRIQNDGLVPASFAVTGTGGAHGLHAHYFAGATNVTSAVRGGVYATPMIAARGSLLLKIVVKASRTSAKHARFTTSVRSTVGTPSDAVILTVRAKN